MKIGLLTYHHSTNVGAMMQTYATVKALKQHDPCFEIYSEDDEQGAAYLACGLSAESQEPVAITCTGATSCDSQKLFLCVFGDLRFYNMNVIGNRSIKPNVRILIINNGLGQEF